MNKTPIGPPNFSRYTETQSQYRNDLVKFVDQLVMVILDNESNQPVLKACDKLLMSLIPVLDYEFPYEQGLGFLLDDWLEFLIDGNKQMADSQKKSIQEDLQTYFKTIPIQPEK